MPQPPQPASSCPRPERLKQLLDATLPEAEQAALSAHVDGCETCQRTLEGLAAGRETWQGAARNLQNAAPEPAPKLQQAIEGLRETPQPAETHIGDSTGAELPLDFLSPPDQPEHLGKIDHYEVLDVVGRGAFGTVLRAFDQRLHRVVAIKVMSPQLASSATARKRFIREGRNAAGVCHEHVITIHHVSEESSPLPYLVMQFVQGVSLQERLDRKGPPALNEILRIGMQAAAGLAAAHAQGLVHRDIKPSNILLENGVERVKITDFGLARAVDDASLTQTGVIAGTPQYMAPEQARGDVVDHRADLFSLGSVLYALCAGRPPFRASTTMAVLKRVCEETPRPLREINPEVPGWLTAIISKLHAKNPADRFQSAQEVADLLGRYLAHVQQPQQFPLPETIQVPHSAAPAGVSSSTQVPATTGLAARLGVQSVTSWINRPVTAVPVIGALLILLSLAPLVHLLRTMGLVGPAAAESPVIALWTASWLAQLGVLFIACLQRVRRGSWSGTVLGSGALFVVIAFVALDIMIGSRIVLPALGSAAGAGTAPDHPSIGNRTPAAPSPASVTGLGRLVVESDSRVRVEVRARLTGPVLSQPSEVPTDLRMKFDQQLPAGTYTLTAFVDVDERPWFRTRLTVAAGKTRRVVIPAPDSDQGRLQGRWIIVSQEASGTKVPADGWSGSQIEFAGDQMRQLLPAREAAEGRFALDTRHDPKQIDYLDEEGQPVMQGIYRLEGETLTLCMGPVKLGQAALARPDEFRTRRNTEIQLSVFRRAQTDTVALEGRWNVVSQDRHGQTLRESERETWWEFKGEQLERSGSTEALHVEVENGSDPKQIDLFTQSGTLVGTGIYQVEEGRMIICMGTPDQRPQVFPARAPPGQVVTMLSRPPLQRAVDDR